MEINKVKYMEIKEKYEKKDERPLIASQPSPSQQQQHRCKQATGWAVAMFHHRKVVSGVIASLVLCTVYVIVIMGYGPSAQDRRFYEILGNKFSFQSTPTEVLPHNISDYKKILLWNDFFGRRDYFLGTGHSPFVSLGCEYSACYVTYNREVFQSTELDALVWHIRSTDKTFPSTRAPHTRYVFFLEEAPVNQDVDLGPYNDVFNYTMTYRRDSDIFAPYGEFERLTKPIEEPNIGTGAGENIAAGKTKMAAWFVSNCNPQSGRDILVQQLQKYITVDVYGSCGPLSCPRNDNQACLRMLQSDYKFYFSFENSLCQDYVTEKYFSIVNSNVLPVVYGMAPYRELSPPHSYISVRDFPTVKKLADYLIYLANNHTAYNEYFKWRSHYSLLSRSKSWCRLCEKLHTDRQEKSYDIHSWYEKNKCVDQATALGDAFFAPDS
uniref:Fucosyltransferase n=2 Tax=Hirondellea gigas TaxID=1518452 RepID=A0A6A7G3Y9_9CRUS